MIEPDMAAKVLAADLRNIVKKVGAGTVLSAGERAMLQNCAVPGGEIKARRAAVLLTKYASGARLSASELGEVREVHPEFVIAPDRVDDPDQQDASSAPVLILQPENEHGPRIVGSRVRYPEPLAVYAKRFGSDERTLKRYVARGREVDPPDLPPFHNPTELPAWCQRRMPNHCPQWILDVATRPAVVAVSTEVQVPASTPPPVDPPAARNFADVQVLDMEQNVEELRRSLAIALVLKNEAQAGTDEAQISIRNRAYNETWDILRKAENDLVAWQRARDILVLKEDVRNENNRIAAVIINAVRRLVKTVRPQLAGKSAPEQDSIWDTETMGCFTALKGAKFTTIDIDVQVFPA